jgi:hypothetical protein
MLAEVLAAAALVLPGSQAQQELSVRPYASGLSALTGIASTTAEPRRLYAVEQVGRIRYFVNGKLGGTFLDIRDRIVSGGEQGLLSMAFQSSRPRVNCCSCVSPTRITTAGSSSSTPGGSSTSGWAMEAPPEIPATVPRT